MATVSAWGKPGAWALDSEAQEAEQRDDGYNSPNTLGTAAAPPSADFPSLSAAAAAKPARKKKPPTLSLAEFATGHSVSHGAAARQSSIAPPFKGLNSNELAALPTGPRERSAEELERSSRGFGHSSYGLGRSGTRDGPRGGAASDEPRRAREPSRDNEFDRERNREGIDSETWGRKSNNEINANGRLNYRDGIDADTWGKKKEDATNSSGGRPRLVLQPRTLSLATHDGNLERKEEKQQQLLQPRTLPLANDNGNIEQNDQQQQPPKKISNPFGAARPREEVLAEKGQDWKKIDEKLEKMKIRDVAPDSVRKGFGVGSSKVDDRTQRTWRKPSAVVDASSSPSPRAEKVGETSADL